MENKLDVINSIDVIDSSASSGELEYVLVADSPETRKKLIEIGASEKEIADATCDMFEGSIDISVIGFSYTGAKWYEDSLGGFIDYVPDHAPEWAK